ncbi:MAG: Wzz/FepE/Etk N-terminal domain-containing protein [Solirubrobacterales bacterium]
MNSEPTIGAPAPRRPATLFDVAHILWRWRWVIVGATILGFLIAAAYTLRQGKEYKAEASALVDRQSIADSLNNIANPGAQPSEGPRVLEAQKQIALAPEVAQATLKAVPGTGLTATELLDDVDVEPDANTDVLHFTILNPDGPKAVELVNAYINEYVDYATEVSQADALAAAKRVRAQVKALNDKGQTNSLQYTRLSRNLESLESLVSLTTPAAQVITTATDYEKAKPKLLIALVLGIVLGGGIGIGVAFLLEALDPRMRTARDVADRSGLALLAELPPSGGAAEPVTLRTRDRDAIEAYRVLLAAVDNVGGLEPGRALLVTADAAPVRGSSAAANLAVAAARAGYKTALVDLGFDSATLSDLLGASDKKGVTEAISGSVSASDVRLPVKIDGDSGPGSLGFYPAGKADDSTAALTGSDSVRTLIDRLAEENDVVILDAGDTASSSSALSASGFAAHTLLVGSLEESSPEALESANRSIALGRSKAAGVAVFS